LKDLLPSRSASTSFKFSRYRSTRWAEDPTSLYVQAVKPAPVGGGAEIVIAENVASTTTCFCSVALDVSPALGVLQYNTYQYNSKSQDEGKGCLSTSAPTLSSAEVGEISLEVYCCQRTWHRQQQPEIFVEMLQICIHNLNSNQVQWTARSTIWGKFNLSHHLIS
jgi:hypothetical protein